MNNHLELATLKRRWIEDAAARFSWWCASGSLAEPFSSDKFYEWFGTPSEPNWMGALTAKLKKRGMIRQIGRAKSERKSRNGAKVNVWEAAK